MTPPPPPGTVMRCWLRLVALQPPDPPQVRQSGEVWAQFGRLFMPGAQRDFMCKALWKKLAVGACKKEVYHQPKCILCSVLETIRHALSKCNFMATDVVTKAFRPVWGPTGVLCPLDKLLVDEPLLSLQRTQGLAMWAAARASWGLRCDAKFRSPKPVLQDFVVLWRTVVESWVLAPQTSFIRQEAHHLQLVISS